MVLLTDLLGVLVISVAASCFIELANWFIIYRQPRFRQFKERLAMQNKKLGEMKAAGGKNKKQKQERLEKNLKQETGKQFGAMKIQQMLIVMGTMAAAYKILAHFYFGKVVAKLPFEPWPFFRKVTLRGLDSTDPTDAAMTLIFSLVQMGVRQNIALWLDLGPSRQMQGMIASNNALIEKQAATRMNM